MLEGDESGIEDREFTVHELREMRFNSDPKATIIIYRKELKKKDKEIAKLKETLAKEIAKRGNFNRRERAKLSTTHWRKYKRKYAITEAKVNGRAKDVYYKKVRDELLKGTNYMDGILAFPILSAFAKQHKVKEMHFCLILITCFHEWVESKDYRYYGEYSVSQVSVAIRQMQRDGWLERYSVAMGKWVYIATVKSQKLFEELREMYPERAKKLFEEHDKNHKLKHIRMTTPLNATEEKTIKVRTPKIDEKHKKTLALRKPRGGQVH